MEKLQGNYAERDIFMLVDDTWGDDEEIFEHFKVYAAFRLGLRVFSTIMDRFDDRTDHILFLRLEILRSECDR